MSININLNDLVTSSEAAEILGVSPGRVRQMVVANELETIKIANRNLVTRSSVDALRQQREHSSEKKIGA